MKQITLTVDFLVEILDNTEVSDLGMRIEVAKSYPIYMSTGEKVGNILEFETTGYFEEEKVGMGEFEEK